MTHIPGALAAPDLTSLGLAFVSAILLVALAILALSFIGSHR